MASASSSASFVDELDIDALLENLGGTDTAALAEFVGVPASADAAAAADVPANANANATADVSANANANAAADVSANAAADVPADAPATAAVQNRAAVVREGWILENGYQGDPTTFAFSEWEAQLTLLTDNLADSDKDSAFQKVFNHIRSLPTGRGGAKTSAAWAVNNLLKIVSATTLPIVRPAPADTPAAQLEVGFLGGPQFKTWPKSLANRLLFLKQVQLRLHPDYPSWTAVLSPFRIALKVSAVTTAGDILQLAAGEASVHGYVEVNRWALISHALIDPACTPLLESSINGPPADSGRQGTIDVHNMGGMTAYKNAKRNELRLLVEEQKAFYKNDYTERDFCWTDDRQADVRISEKAPLKHVRPELGETTSGETFYAVLTTITHAMTALRVKINASGGHLVGAGLEDKICAFSHAGPGGALDRKLLYAGLLLHDADTRFTSMILPQGLGTEMGVITPAAAASAGAPAAPGQTPLSPVQVTINAGAAARASDKASAAAQAKGMQIVFAATLQDAQAMMANVSAVLTPAPRKKKREVFEENNKRAFQIMRTFKRWDPVDQEWAKTQIKSSYQSDSD
eukprot:CAMPEP_0173273016 /NCGR_PEP_ID=MMETSP1143-20121109/1675_1 /TAXON_ID=483371 /ORGANISM="non described non described, Strain CCMP2298" /LENGTH=576 /DNA_ID=CAMNT_0014209719 /DNA_START=59 /DNA_END=1789 /DNA_ORIENTATION=+